MTDSRDNMRFFVQLECKHIVYFKNISCCPQPTTLIVCFRCPMLNDRYVFKRVVYSPHVIIRRQIRHIGLTVLCNDCQYYEVCYQNIGKAMNYASKHNTKTKHSTFVIRNSNMLIASYTIGQEALQLELPLQRNNRALS